jgi:D-alanine-D-alanine ligase-like ATP-grasp enzyme
MEATKSSPGTTYEIFGYDIVLDDDLNPFLCEINETPNMGLEVNYHGDYNGLGA